MYSNNLVLVPHSNLVPFPPRSPSSRRKEVGARELTIQSGRAAAPECAAVWAMALG